MLPVIRGPSLASSFSSVLKATISLPNLLLRLAHLLPTIPPPLPLVPRLVKLMPEVNPASKVLFCDGTHTPDVRLRPGCKSPAELAAEAQEAVAPPNIANEARRSKQSIVHAPLHTHLYASESGAKSQYSSPTGGHVARAEEAEDFSGEPGDLCAP
ncbi:hypothetical protein ACJZ2D_015885 [Fusarium nematophilum]